jgi:hypothetical protein
MTSLESKMQPTAEPARSAQALARDAKFVRLATIGFGASLPVADNETSEGRARNRRTEVVLVRPVPTMEATRGMPPTAAR